MPFSTVVGFRVSVYYEHWYELRTYSLGDSQSSLGMMQFWTTVEDQKI
jgi:hypothetical protein